MHEEPLPCPFCGQHLVKKHMRYTVMHGKIIEYNHYDHPQNECILADRICEYYTIRETDIDKWNHRINPYSLFETVQNPEV